MPAFYGTLAAANAYHLARGRAAWGSATEDARLAAMARGSDHVDGYDGQFPGYPAGGSDQERSWPRAEAEDRYGNPLSAASVPSRVERASYEAGYLELVKPGSLSAVTSEAARISRVKAGSVEVQYASTSSTGAQAALPTSTLIEAILFPLLIGEGNGEAIPNVLMV